MKVFKACLTITRRHVVTLVIYLLIFGGLFVAMTQFYFVPDNNNFDIIRPNYTLINRDGPSPLTQGLAAYLDRHGTAVSLEDKKEALQDASFFHATDYIAIIPQGFARAMEENAPQTLETVTIPDSAKGYHMRQLTEQYLNMYLSYQKTFPDLSPESLADSVLSTLSEQGEVEKLQLSENSPVPELVLVYVRMYAYICMVLIMLIISTILMVFRRPDLNLRHVASPLKTLSKNMQMGLFGACIMLLVFFILILTCVLPCHEYLADMEGRTLGLFALNMLTFAVVSLSLAMLCSNFIRNLSLQNAVANLLSLGLSFFGGIFVPLAMLGENIKQVARLTPTYWYSITCDRIGSLASYSKEALSSVFQGIFIQLGFAAALFLVSLVIARYKSREEQPMGSINTEYQL